MYTSFRAFVIGATLMLATPLIANECYQGEQLKIEIPQSSCGSWVCRQTVSKPTYSTTEWVRDSQDKESLRVTSFPGEEENNRQQIDELVQGLMNPQQTEVGRRFLQGTTATLLEHSPTYCLFSLEDTKKGWKGYMLYLATPRALHSVGYSTHGNIDEQIVEMLYGLRASHQFDGKGCER